MKYKLNLTMLAVAALVYGLCGTSQAVTEVFDFNGIVTPGTGPSAYVALATLGGSITSNSFVMSVSSVGSGAVYDNGAYTAINNFDGGVYASWHHGDAVTFTRTDAMPFSAKSLVLGALGVNGDGEFYLTGNHTDGGAVSLVLRGIAGSNTTVNLPDGFGNITNLVIAGSPDGMDPVFDDLTFDDAFYSPPVTSVVIDFNGGANDGGVFTFWHPDWGGPVADGEHSEDGYTVTTTNTGGLGDYRIYIVDDTWTFSPAVAPFEDDCVFAQVPGSGFVTITRDGGLPFSAKSLIVGSYAADSAVTLTGNRGGVPVATTTFTAVLNGHTTETLPASFGGLDSLTIDFDVGAGGGNAIVDDITLEEFIAPGTILVIK